jgi:hypothetical protein
MWHQRTINIILYAEFIYEGYYFKGIRGLMGEKGLMEEDWNDRSNWRKKIICTGWMGSK